MDFNLLSQQAERLCECLYFRRKPLQPRMNYGLDALRQRSFAFCVRRVRRAQKLFQYERYTVGAIDRSGKHSRRSILRPQLVTQSPHIGWRQRLQMNDRFNDVGDLVRRFRSSGQQYAKRLRSICAREQFQEMTAFRVDPLQVFDQQKSWPAERQYQEGIDKRARNLRLRIVVQSLARSRFFNDEQGFKRPAIACLEVQFRERLAKLGIRREAVCSEQFA